MVQLLDGVHFLEPYISLATRSVPIFHLLQNAMTSLYELEEGEMNESAPISFRFLTNEFQRFVVQAQENMEMKQILSDLFDSLTHVADYPTQFGKCERRKQSIVDPGFVHVCGPQTMSTSSKIDVKAVPPKTK